MSSELSVFDCSFFTDPFFPFTDSSIDVVLQAIPLPDENNPPTLQNPFDEVNNVDQIASAAISSSTPNHQMENLSLCPTTHLQDSSLCENQIANFSNLEVKTENFQLLPPTPHSNLSFRPYSYGGPENVAKMIQRSFSINCSDGKTGFLFNSHCDNNLTESPHFLPQVLNTPENSFSSGKIRRVFSTEDLRMTKTNQGLSSSPLAAESTFGEESNLKAGRYSAEVRKERIHRYRAKRTHRNFNKTIKYACRKTLADNRVRVRGRFARNEETGEVPKAATFNGEEVEDDLWVEEATMGGQLFSIVGPTQFQYCGYC